MTFILYCDHDLQDLGIEDAQGVWDWDKFREHAEVCLECSRFRYFLGDYLLEHLKDAFGG